MSIHLNNIRKKMENHILDKAIPLFKATALVVEDFIDKNSGEHIELDLDISFGSFNTQEDAENAAKKVTIYVQKKVGLSNEKELLAGIADEENNVWVDAWMIDMEDVIFKRIKKSKKEKMGKPLDPKDADSLNKIKESLNPESPMYEQYVISEDDMEIVDYDLDYFLSHYSINTELQNVAYGYKDMSGK